MSHKPIAPASTDVLAMQLVAAQDQLDALQEQLTESQRLATIGTIAAVIAHEFNNLLTPIVSYSQYALQSAEGEAPDMALIRKALAKAFQSSSKAGKICQSMLGLARGESFFSDVTVQHLVDEVLLVLARDPQKDGIALRVQVQPELRVHADPVQLEQVLLNLLINARHAMLGKGGSLTIKASACEGSNELKLQVIDTGPGIPEKLLGKIFLPFFTTKGTAQRGESFFSDVPVQYLVDEVLLVLARDPQKDGIALRVQVQPGLTVHGDPIQLEQVLLNLLINARHALLGRGGSLTVKASATDDPTGEI
ncbi:MAG: ATP-binding protein, partial [Planctomycetota bacterium]|nr:ATP-binding protein [Planctomycetota bacterium]